MMVCRPSGVVAVVWMVKGNETIPSAGVSTAQSRAKVQRTPGMLLGVLKVTFPKFEIMISPEQNRKGQLRAPLHNLILLQEFEAVTGTLRLLWIRAAADLISIGEQIVIIVSQPAAPRWTGRIAHTEPIFNIGVVIGQESSAGVREIRLRHQTPGPLLSRFETTQLPDNHITELNAVIALENPQLKVNFPGLTSGDLLRRH